ncbi:MAG: hypothetical protein Q4D96_13890 [Propionibacteriaceae bacterium]|nr:hypothetical protein [Propionibacteriaceae bacterium]
MSAREHVTDEDDIPTEEIPGLPILPDPVMTEAPSHPPTPVLGEPTTEPLPRPVPQPEPPAGPPPDPVAERRRREMQAYRATIWRAWFIRLVRFLNRIQTPVALLTPVVVALGQWVLPTHDLPGWAARSNALLWLGLTCLLVAGEVSTGRPRWVSLAGCVLRSTTIALAGLAFAQVSATSWVPAQIGEQLVLPGGLSLAVEPTVARTVVALAGFLLLFPFILTIAQGMRQHLNSTTRFGHPDQPSFKVSQVGHDPWTLGIPATPLVISQYRRRVIRFYFGRVFMALWWVFALAVMAAVATA